MFWIVISSILIGLIIGAVLGSRLSLAGISEMFIVVCRIPTVLIRSPHKIKTMWNQWHEERTRAAIARLKRKEQIQTLNERISNKKKEIRELKHDIRRVKWQLKEPPSSV